MTLVSVNCELQSPDANTILYELRNILRDVSIFLIERYSKFEVLTGGEFDARIDFPKSIKIVNNIGVGINEPSLTDSKIPAINIKLHKMRADNKHKNK